MVSGDVIKRFFLGPASVSLLILVYVIIAGCVIGLGGDTWHSSHSHPQALATCSEGSIVVTYSSGGMEPEQIINMTVYESTPSHSVTVGGISGTLPIRSTATIKGPFASRPHVIAEVFFNDGSREVILDMYLPCGSGSTGTRTVVPDTTQKHVAPTPIKTPKSGDVPYVYVNGCWDKETITLNYKSDKDNGKTEFIRWYINGNEMWPRMSVSTTQVQFPYTSMHKKSDLFLLAHFRDGYDQQVYVNWCMNTIKAPWE